MSKPSRKRRNPIIAERRSLTPHSPEWLALLVRIDPVKARMTYSVLHRSGRLDVFSICGDTPAPIHDLMHEPWLPVRLCADCAEIRNAMGDAVVRRDGKRPQGACPASSSRT